MKKALREKQAFSLIEIIVALAILAIAATVLVRLFSAAGQSAARAADTDNAARAASAQIELFRAAPTPAAYTEDFACMAGDRAAAQWVLYYNAAWQRDTVRSDDGFVLETALRRDGEPQQTDGVISELYGIDVVVRAIGKGDELVRMQTSKLFIYRP